jgi:hypothetical protein
LNLLDNFLNILLTGGYSREFEVRAVGLVGDDACQGSFADSRRPPKDHRIDLILLNRQIQRFAWADEMALADELVERLRADAICKGLGGHFSPQRHRGHRGLLYHRRSGNEWALQGVNETGIIIMSLCFIEQENQNE